MVNIGLIRMILGLGLQGIGLIWSLLNRFVCVGLCENGICTTGDDFACFGILLFVGIILIVAGYALVSMKPKEKKKLKRKIKRYFE